MSTNLSLFRRARFVVVALVIALVAASCGGGDESVSSRTRNSGAAPTLEECFADNPWYGDLSDEEMAVLANDLANRANEYTAELNEAQERWLREGADAQEKIEALKQWAAFIVEAQERGIAFNYEEMSDEDQAWVEEQHNRINNAWNEQDEAFQEIGMLSMMLNDIQTEQQLIAAIQAAASTNPAPTTPAPTTPAPTTAPASAPEDGPETSVWVDDPETSVWLEGEEEPDSTLPMDDHHADGPDEVIENHNESLKEISLEEQKIKDLTEKIEEQRQLAEQLEEARLEAMRETDGVVEKLSGEELAYEGDWESASEEEQDSYVLLYDKASQNASQEAIDMLNSAEQNEWAATENANTAKDDLDDLEQELQDAYENYGVAVDQAIDDQNTGVQDYGDATSQVANSSAEGLEAACQDLYIDVQEEGLADVIATMEALQQVRDGAARDLDAILPDESNQGGENSPSIDSLVETADDREEVTDVIPGAPEAALKLDAIPAALDDDTQVQIPTAVVLLDEAVVEIQEIVDEIVVTPVAAEQMLANAGVDGIVAVKAGGDWQAVPASESLVVPVGLDDEGVEIRLIPADLSKPVVSQNVDLKRVGTKQLLDAEELAALVPLSQSDDSSSLMWLLYVVIGVLALAAAVLFGQRRKASAS